MRLHQSDKIIILSVLDLVAMILAFISALYVGHRPPVSLGLIGYYRWGLATLVVSVYVIFFIIDLYSLHKMPDRYLYQILYMGAGLFFSAMVVTVVFFFFRFPVPRAVFMLFYLFSGVLIAGFRYVFSSLTLSLVFWRVLVVGEAEPAVRVCKLIAERKYLHTEIVGLLSNAASYPVLEGVSYLGSTENMIQIVEREDVDQVIVAQSHVDSRLMGQLLACMKMKVKVSDFKLLMETVSGRIPIDFLSDTWFLSVLGEKDKRYTWYAKRCIDIIFSVIGMSLSAPLLPVAATLIKLDSPGPVFYSQMRIGRRGVPFRVWKLRTMIVDADKNDSHWTLDNDARITRLGRFIRKTHLDELPQFWNILKGEMTLVGPRPEAVSLVELYRKDIPYYDERHMVTPGVTGWAQINFPYGNSVEDTREKLKYDFYYVKNRNLILDFIILLRTTRTVLTGKGAL